MTRSLCSRSTRFDGVLVGAGRIRSREGEVDVRLGMFVLTRRPTEGVVGARTSLILSLKVSSLLVPYRSCLLPPDCRSTASTD